MTNTNNRQLRERFLQGMSLSAATVSVVTTAGAAGRAGVTVSAMTSVSADGDAPTLLICVHHLSAAAEVIIQNGCFCTNILRDDQIYISDVFSGREQTADHNKFSCANWLPMASGALRAVAPLAAFDCRVKSSERVGTHYVFIGEVGEIFTAGTGNPLIYANRAYGSPTQIHHPPAADQHFAGERVAYNTDRKEKQIMAHKRLRKFNTRDTYPEQNLDNDLCHVVVARGTMVFVRGQCPQNIEDGKNLASADPGEQTHKAMQNIRQLIEEAGGKMEHLVKLVVYLTDIRHREPVYRAMGEYLRGIHPVSTGVVVDALARPEWLVEIDATAVIPDSD